MTYHEKITCKCGNIIYREIEIKTTNLRSKDMEKPLTILIIKKYQCSKCKEIKNYKIEIIKK